jgi:lipid-binding SYLF domain-containing protein
MTTTKRTMFAMALAIAAVCSTSVMSGAVFAASSADLDHSSAQALESLYKTNPTAGVVAKHAKAILVFPNIVKAGLVFGGSYGEGELMEGSKVEDYYNSVSGSWGLQAGAQSYGYAVFLMTDEAIAYIHKSRGWEIGVGPTVVVVNEGVAKNLTSSTLKDAAYAFVFDQQGLMASLSIEGTKISRIKR